MKATANILTHCTLGFTVQNNMLIHQMDVVTAILNGKLEEEIYTCMQQPEKSTLYAS